MRRLRLLVGGVVVFATLALAAVSPGSSSGASPPLLVFASVRAAGDDGASADEFRICSVRASDRAIAAAPATSSTPPRSARCSPSVWSPDGRTIFGGGDLRGPTSDVERDRLRLVRTGSYGSGLVGFDVATGKPRVVLHGIPSAVFSPDGARIAYDAEGECGDVHQIYVANADGSGRRLVSGNCHIVGSPGPEVLHGQVVIGLAGNDTLCGTETLDASAGDSSKVGSRDPPRSALSRAGESPLVAARPWLSVEHDFPCAVLPK